MHIAPTLPALKPLSPPSPGVSGAHAALPAVPTAAVAAPQAAAFNAIFNFPTLVSGTAFKIVSGSTANGLGIGGNARLDEITPTSAKVWIKAGKFGFNKEANLSIAQSSPTTAAISATEPGKAPIVGSANIVDVRQNYSKFTSADPNINGGAEMQVNERGQFIVDVKGDGAGIFSNVDLHLILEKI